MKIMTKVLHHFHLLLLFFSDSILASVDERPAINWLFDNREAGHRIIGTEQWNSLLFPQKKQATQHTYHVNEILSLLASHEDWIVLSASVSAKSSFQFLLGSISPPLLERREIVLEFGLLRGFLARQCHQPIWRHLDSRPWCWVRGLSSSEGAWADTASMVTNEIYTSIFSRSAEMPDSAFIPILRQAKPTLYYDLSITDRLSPLSLLPWSERRNAQNSRKLNTAATVAPARRPWSNESALVPFPARRPPDSATEVGDGRQQEGKVLLSDVQGAGICAPVSTYGSEGARGMLEVFRHREALNTKLSGFTNRIS